jgi:chemotaxis protein CheZ
LSARLSEVASKQEISASAEVNEDDVLLRVGQMTRSLHDSLRGLGFDKLLSQAADDIPDARDRLDYVAKLTEKAAQRVLAATEDASPLQAKIDKDAGMMAEQWNDVLNGPFSEERYRAMAAQTVAYLSETRTAAQTTKQYLLDIVMAQDFQDLTGQVIKKITELVHGLEHQLLQILIDHVPSESRRDNGNELLNGPQINPLNNSDVVADQKQVDDLLESLGF